MNRKLCAAGKWLALVALAVMFASCDKDSVDMNVLFTCSDDLLEFVTPTVEYDDEHEDKQLIELTTSVLKDNGDGMKKWETHLHFNHFNVPRKFKVSYKIKDGVEKDKEQYHFVHSFGCSVATEKDGKKITIENNQEVKVDLTGYFVEKANVHATLSNLIANPQTLYVEVDENGHVTYNKE